MIDTSIDLLTSVYSLLSGDATLTGLIGAGHVHTRPSEAAALPYVVIRDDFPRDWLQGDGMEHTLDVHIFTDDDSDLPALEIRKRIVALLTAHAVAETDAKSVCLYFENAVMLPREIGEGGAHGVASFIVKMEEV